MKKVKDAKVEAITASELKKLQEMVGGMNQLQTTIGGYEAQKHDLLHQLAGAKNELSEYQKELTETYGTILLDRKCMVVIP